MKYNTPKIMKNIDGSWAAYCQNGTNATTGGATFTLCVAVGTTNDNEKSAGDMCYNGTGDDGECNFCNSGNAASQVAGCAPVGNTITVWTGCQAGGGVV